MEHSMCGGRSAGADTLLCTCCALQVTCDRCGDASTVLTLSSEAISAQQGSSKAGSQVYEAAQECGGCHQRLAVALLPRLVHEHSNVWGVLRPQQCTPLDLLPAIVGVQCGDCGSVATMRGVQVRKGGWPCRAGVKAWWVTSAGVLRGVHGSVCRQLQLCLPLWLLVALAVEDGQLASSSTCAAAGGRRQRAQLQPLPPPHAAHHRHGGLCAKECRSLRAGPQGRAQHAGDRPRQRGHQQGGSGLQRRAGSWRAAACLWHLQALRPQLQVGLPVQSGAGADSGSGC